MSLAVKDHVSFYSSPNLKDWSFESDFGASLGLILTNRIHFTFPDWSVRGNKSGNVKWILLVSINPGGPQGGSATQYFVGDFDGKAFTPHDDKIRWLDYGADNYAGVTYSDIPKEDGRRLFIGWMSNWNYAQIVPTKSWRSAMTIPRELKLDRNDEGFYVKSQPIVELSRLGKNEIEHNGQNFTTNNGSFVIEINQLIDEDLSLTLSNDLDDKLKITIQDSVVLIDRTNAGNSDFDSTFAAVHKAITPKLPINDLTVYMDNSSVELFINEGELMMTDLLFPSKPLTKVEFNQKQDKLKVNDLGGIWSEAITEAEHE